MPGLTLPLALGLMLASGFAGLGYQLVWTQQGALWLGHEAAALLAVVSAFFGGMALGAWCFSARIEASRRPARWYAGCEVLIALWALVLALGMPTAGAWLLRLTGPEAPPAWQACVAFAGMFVLLLPATAAMGATLPAMERMLAARVHVGDGVGGGGGGGGGGRAQQTIAALYACNTAGALLGVLATAFWLLPGIGLLHTAWVCVALNLACAATALVLDAPSAGAAMTPNAASAAGAAVPAHSDTRHTLPLLAATGLLGIGYQVLVVRVLSQVNENTVYTYAILLGVYLLGTAAGAALLRRLGKFGSADTLLQLLAASCLLGGASLWWAEGLRALMLQTQVLQAQVPQAFGPGMAQALLAETVLALAAFALPTLLMGALFSRLALQARAAGIGLGRALAVNTLGAAAAPPLVGVLLAPAIGAKAALLLVAASYLLLAAPRRWWQPAGLTLAASTAALAVFAPPLVFIDVPEGGRVVSYADGAVAAVSVVEDAQGVLRLRINNRQQEGSSDTLAADARQAWLPLLLHPAPQRALFLGLGTGMTARAAAADSTLQVDAVELLPDVIAAASHFVAAGDGQGTGLRVVNADARRFVRTAGPAYDVIVADNYHPARSGSGALYTVEHFAAVHARLAAEGLFCQGLPLHQLDLATLRSVVQSFRAVFPGAGAILAPNSLQTPVLGLVGRADTRHFDLQALRQRAERASAAGQLARYDIQDAFDVLGAWVAGPSDLAAFAGDAPANTDDLPVVAHMAPRITYAPDTLPQDRLLALLDPWTLNPADLLDAGSDTQWLGRLAAHAQARKRYLAVGRGVQPMADPRQMLAQVRQPLLAVLQISPDFRPAREPLLRMAQALGRSDAAAAQAVLDDVARVTAAAQAAADAGIRPATAVTPTPTSTPTPMPTPLPMPTPTSSPTAPPATAGLPTSPPAR